MSFRFLDDLVQPQADYLLKKKYMTDFGAVYLSVKNISKRQGHFQNLFLKYCCLKYIQVTLNFNNKYKELFCLFFAQIFLKLLYFITLEDRALSSNCISEKRINNLYHHCISHIILV